MQKKAFDLSLKSESKHKISYFKTYPYLVMVTDLTETHGLGTLNATNFWWSITGVNKKSGLLIFPKVNSHKLSHIKNPAM